MNHPRDQDVLTTAGSMDSATLRVTEIFHSLQDETSRVGLPTVFIRLTGCPVLFAPSYRELSAPQLADWILRDQLPVRLQIQLHKSLWGEKPGV